KNWWLHTLPASDGKGVRFGMANGSGGVTKLEYVFPEATADNWHNVVVSFSGASVLLYVDGELIETAVTGYEAGQSPLFLGQKTDATGHFTGGIDELRFYNRQLAQTEIQMFMNRTVAPNAAGLVNYWKFDEGVGSKSFDLTASKQKLYFCGASWSSDKPNVVNAGLTDETGF
ncbi:MAG: LamG domain-containing protein, partial [Bacteroidota bacterium]